MSYVTLTGPEKRGAAVGGNFVIHGVTESGWTVQDLGPHLFDEPSTVRRGISYSMRHHDANPYRS
jgi:hypothetical protein